ncbi:histidine kinase [Sphingomonas sp. RP10(2022)]|uniref:Histidine kinase n=1 Tax=Sphingomonas liriopis TaxID=2949094 RepID=A0A9X2KQ96_9SPHN|nr:histidine kinase [Sphingomonas liriopis]MCP3734321.1 histidine kinase [Sphingomonas liriopis]
MEALLRQVMRGTAVRLCAVVWTFGYVLVAITGAAQGRSGPAAMFVANVPLLLLGIVQSIALGLLFDRLATVPGVARWIIVALAGMVAALVQTIADHYLLSAIALTVAPDWRAWALDVQPGRKFAILILYLWTLYLTIALMWALRTSDMAKLNEARAAAFAAAASRAEAAALRLQLNPHFLFNTLNGIASLVVRRQQDEAEEMIGRLADFLRSSLAADPTALVPLDQEIATVRAYLAIEEARFGPRLSVSYAIDPALALLDVPNFILQPLVENAIQHGAAPVRGAVSIAIEAQRGEDMAILSVTNRAAHRGAAPQPRAGHGIGLTNTRARLATQYGDAARLDGGPLADGYRVEIALPFDAAARRAA